MVKWSLPAKHDLKEVHDFIAKDSKFYAKKVSEEIIQKTKLLKKFPKLGRIVPEINDENTRELILYSYRIIYQVSGEKIEILTVINCSKELKPENI